MNVDLLKQSSAVPSRPLLKLNWQWVTIAIRKDPYSGKDWRQEKKTEDKMFGWHHWTGKPGVLQSVGSQRVRPDWATEQPATSIVIQILRRGFFFCGLFVCFFTLFYWRIVDLQCVNFCCMAKWFNDTYSHSLFHILFYYSLFLDIEYSSLCYTAGRCCLFILCKHPSSLARSLFSVFVSLFLYSR